MVKALALFSGGLDSALAAKIVLDQGVAVEAVHFINVFLTDYNPDINECAQLQKRQAASLGLKLHILDIAKQHLAMVLQPRYGYGKNANPCVDCRILMLTEAKNFMQQHGFSFLISGEVLGQRPMSQRKDTLNIVERDGQVKGLLLRPLSARILKPTVAEENGWVDREKLFAFSGRSRKGQLSLAKSFALEEYLTPSGGCLLTDVEFTRKFRDLTATIKPSVEDLQLLKVGRHFRYKKTARIVVGRDDTENKRLSDLAQEGDLLLKIRQFSGPLTLIRSHGIGWEKSLIEIAAGLTGRYGKGKNQESLYAECWLSTRPDLRESILVKPATDKIADELRI